MSAIEIRNLYKAFDENEVLRGVDLNIEKGETLVIVGRSGCGKSVLLKHIIGLLHPDRGTIRIEGQVVNNLSMKELYALRKKFGFLFQGAALFDSMTVFENVSLPLVESSEHYTPKEIENLVSEKLEIVGLPDIGMKKPAELSGGMKKRVGLARALVTNPDFILYDEPTTGLDPIMSDNIDTLIKELSEKLSVTAIVVTHDMFSVNNVADRVAMMHDGKIHFDGTPTALNTSEDKAIYEFIKRTEKLS